MDIRFTMGVTEWSSSVWHRTGAQQFRCNYDMKNSIGICHIKPFYWSLNMRCVDKLWMWLQKHIHFPMKQILIMIMVCGQDSIYSYIHKVQNIQYLSLYKTTDVCSSQFKGKYVQNHFYPPHNYSYFLTIENGNVTSSRVNWLSQYCNAHAKQQPKEK